MVGAMAKGSTLSYIASAGEAGKEFQLCYDELEDAWWLKEFVGGTPG